MGVSPIGIKRHILETCLLDASLNTCGAFLWVITQGMGFMASPVYGKIVSQSFLTCFDVSLPFAWCEGIAPPVFSFFSEEIVPYIVIDLMLLWEE